MEVEAEVEVEVGVVAFKGGEVSVAEVAQPEVVAVAVEASGVEGDLRQHSVTFSVLFSVVIFGCMTSQQ